jgi:tungstate transport system ATP-binding protein
MTDRLIYRAQQLQRQLGSFRLEIASFDVQRGEVMGLIGPTGAGKTTLLRLLAGLDLADSGRLLFDGQLISGSQLDLETRRRMTLVPQNPLLLTGTVRHNVEFGLRLRGSLQPDNAVDEVLEGLGLSAIVDQSAATLSGGQVQLVALARALVLRPDVLLLDEPTAHLDPAHVGMAEVLIEQVQQQCQTTVIWATHNHFQARRVTDRTGLLLNGELVEVNDTQEIFSQPADPRTADFIRGQMVY